MDIYVNARAAGVRIVQYVTFGAAILFVFVGYTEGAPEFAPIGAVLGAACLACFELFYIRKQVTRVSQASGGWVMRTLSTFGERTVRFEASQARFGGALEQQTLYGETYRYHPFYVAGRRYLLDATPPTQVDAAAFQHHFPN